MKTINIRLLVQDDVDGEQVVETILEITRAPEPDILGAVELVDDGFGRLVPAPQVHTRPNVRWDGNPEGGA